MIYLLMLVISSIVLGAIGDSRYDYGEYISNTKAKSTGKLLKDLEIFTLLLTPLVLALSWYKGIFDSGDIVFAFISFFFGYILVRFGLFDYTYNISRSDVTWDHIGGVGWYSKLRRAVNPGSIFWIFPKILALGTGIILLIRAV